MKRNFKKLVSIGAVALLLVSGGPVRAMDRWSALSLLESGDNDDAVGRAGEISRFQIKPGLWEKFSGSYPLAASTNPRTARQVAQAIMHERCREFERRFHRAPTDFEYYVLWNAPAQIENPHRVVMRRAVRFCNLVGS